MIAVKTSQKMKRIKSITSNRAEGKMVADKYSENYHIIMPVSFGAYTYPEHGDYLVQIIDAHVTTEIITINIKYHKYG